MAIPMTDWKMTDVFILPTDEPLLGQPKQLPGYSPWLDVSNESERSYLYPKAAVTYKEPIWVAVSNDGASHRLILDGPNGDAGAYVVPGWLGIVWQLHDDSEVHSF